MNTLLLLLSLLLIVNLLIVNAQIDGEDEEGRQEQQGKYIIYTSMQSYNNEFSNIK